jgi:hypothetical protein
MTEKTRSEHSFEGPLSSSLDSIAHKPQKSPQVFIRASPGIAFFHVRFIAIVEMSRKGS